MKKHTGMRPHDIVILVKIFTSGDQLWLNKDLSNQLHISQAEFSWSLQRSLYAGLLDDKKQRVLLANFYEFLVFGMPFVFPQRPAEQSRGVPTAHSHPDLKKLFPGENKYVWPDEEGKEIGFSIHPFYTKQTRAIRQDPELYLILSLIEIIRVGRSREVNFARRRLKSIFRLE